MDDTHKDAIWRIITEDNNVDDLVMKIMQDYEYGAFTADDTIKSLVIIATSRLKHIRLIEDMCYDFIDEEMPPFV